MLARQEESQMDTDQLRYGFRYDPMTWVQRDRSVQAAQVRTFVFKEPQPGDEEVIEAEIDRILTEIERVKDVDDDARSREPTFRDVRDLLALGCAPDAPRLKALIDYGREVVRACGKLGAVPFYAARALAMAGAGDEPKVAEWLRWKAERPGDWMEKGCPNGQRLHAEALWGGRNAVDTRATADSTFRWMAEGMNETGCMGYWNPWSFVDCAGYAGHDGARDVVVKAMPFILRGQLPDGGWGDRSHVVLRALAQYGLLEPLREAPALPPDWCVVRSIPAPEGDLFSMAWDGRRLWVYDQTGNEVIALSPDGGAVLKRTKLHEPGAFAIGSWDGRLAAIHNDPCRLLKIDPDTGGTEQAFELDNYWDGAYGAARVGDRLWVIDGLARKARKYSLAGQELPGCEHRMPSPEPVLLTPAVDAVWYIDGEAPLIVKTDHSGKLLDFGDQPFFDGSGEEWTTRLGVQGLAFDGENLWALDAKKKRICVIEQTGER